MSRRIVSPQTSAGFLVVLLLALCAAGRVSTSERAWITILSTTDLHGNILPVDYYTGRILP